MFGSFHAAQSRTAGSVLPLLSVYWPLYRAAAAYAKPRRSAKFFGGRFELWPPFVISVAVFTFFLVIDRVYQLTDLVIGKQVPARLVLALLLYLLPPLLSLSMPIAVLMAVLIAGGRLSADLEVAALKASGVSPARLLRPVLAVGIIASVFIGWLTLAVNPWASAAFQRRMP